jgi:hypothetical protein
VFDNFKKPGAYSVVFQISGILIFILQVIFTHSFSFLGVITFIVGLGLFSLISASKAELNKLRIENIDLRKRIEEIEKLKQHY